MSEFHFIRPWALLALIPYLYWLWLSHRAKRHTQTKLPLAAHLAPYLNTGHQGGKRFSPMQLLPMVMGTMIVIVSGPAWHPEEGSLAKNRSPLIFVIDLSSSMAQSDVAPSRIESAKHKLTRLLASKNDGLVGAWVYAGSGHQLIPPTEDREVLTVYLQSLNTRLVPRQGKDIATVLSQLKQQQNTQSVPASIVVISDSIDNEARQAISAYQKDSQDQLLLWKFGFASSMSSPRGIELLQMTADDTDIEAIISWVNQFSFFDPEDTNIVWAEAGYWLVFPTLLLSLLWFRRGWSIHWVGVILLLPLLSMAPTSEANAQGAAKVAVGEINNCDNLFMRLLMTPDQQGQWFYQRQDFSCAANSFVDPQWKVEALMRSNQWEWALTMLNTQPDSLTRRFNIGMSYLHLARFRSAQRWFQQVLLLEPEHPQATYNLTVLDDIFELMEQRAQGQGTAGEDMTADVIDSLQEDMQIDEPADKIELVNSADLIAEEHLTKIWLEQVKRDPAVFLRNKFTLQLQKDETDSSSTSQKTDTQTLTGGQ